jgi:hypothetical protein
MHNERHDLLREHSRTRRDRLLGELRGMEAGLHAVLKTPGGDETRIIIDGHSRVFTA